MGRELWDNGNAGSSFAKSSFVKSSFAKTSFVKSTFAKSSFAKSSFARSSFGKSSFAKSSLATSSVVVDVDVLTVGCRFVDRVFVLCVDELTVVVVVGVDVCIGALTVSISHMDLNKVCSNNRIAVNNVWLDARDDIKKVSQDNIYDVNEV